jgi:hypothetical protein
MKKNLKKKKKKDLKRKKSEMYNNSIIMDEKPYDDNKNEIDDV